MAFSCAEVLAQLQSADVVHAAKCRLRVARCTCCTIASGDGAEDIGAVGWRDRWERRV